MAGSPQTSVALLSSRFVRGRVWPGPSTSTTRLSSGQWKSTSMSSTWVLTSGSGSPDSLVRARKRSSSSLRGARAASGVELERAFEHLEIVAAVGPGHRGADGALVEQVAERGLVDHVRELVGVSTSLRSTSVRGTVVTGIPSRRVTSRGSRLRYVRTRTPRKLALARREHVNVRDSAAPELHVNCGIEGGEVGIWPHARIAAIHSPCRDSRGCPTAYTPLYLRCRRPFAARLEMPRVPEPGTDELGGR